MRDKTTQHTAGGPRRTPAPRQGQGGEKKANRNNPTFKNRCNSLTTKKKTFSNRDKNTYSALPHFRPSPTLPTLRGPIPRLPGPVPTLRDQSLHFENRIRRKSLKTRRPRNFNRYKNRPYAWAASELKLAMAVASSVNVGIERTSRVSSRTALTWPTGFSSFRLPPWRRRVTNERTSVLIPELSICDTPARFTSTSHGASSASLRSSALSESLLEPMVTRPCMSRIVMFPDFRNAICRPISDSLRLWLLGLRVCNARQRGCPGARIITPHWPGDASHCAVG